MSFFATENETHTANQIVHQISRFGVLQCFGLGFPFYALTNKRNHFLISYIIYH